MWLSKKRILNKKQLPLAQPALGESNEEKEHGEKIDTTGIPHFHQLPRPNLSKQDPFFS